MIVSFDHIAWVTNDISKDIEKFLACGYQQEFFEKEIPNPKIKNELMTNYSKSHSLCMLKKPGSISIEIIEYEDVSTGEPFVNFSLKNSASIEFYGSCFNKSSNFWKTLSFIETSNESELLYKPILYCSDLKLSVKSNNTDVSWGKLDQAGFNAPAFVSNNLQKEVERFKNAKIEHTEIEEIVVAGKTLEVCFVIGPCKEVVEIIGLKN